MSDIDAAFVRSILDYDPETGVFTWRPRPIEHFKTERAWKIWNTRFSGTFAGGVDGNGYCQIAIDNKRYKSHRLAWLYMTGEWPKDQIDHVNMTRADNRFCNMREATNSENGGNRGAQCNNTSGYKGVNWRNDKSRWRAKIRSNGKDIHLGYFDCPAAASFAYQISADKHHGEFARAS